MRICDHSRAPPGTLAMQKVVGSSPIIRFTKPPQNVTVQVAVGVSGAGGGRQPRGVIGEAGERVEYVAALLAGGADVGA
jgi:hypothetical protein